MFLLFEEQLGKCSLNNKLTSIWETFSQSDGSRTFSWLLSLIRSLISREYFTDLVISRPSGPTRYCTIHWHASLLLDSNTSTVAIHSSVSTLQEIQEQCRYNTDASQGGFKELMYVCIPEFLFGVQVCVEEKVNSQLETLFGHGLVVRMLQFCLRYTKVFRNILFKSPKLTADELPVWSIHVLSLYCITLLLHCIKWLFIISSGLKKVALLCCNVVYKPCVKSLCSSTMYLLMFRQTNTDTYCIDGGERESEVEVVAVVDVSVPHELEIFISYHLYNRQTVR